MIKSVHYGQYEFAPWHQNSQYINLEAKSLKSYRCKEPRPLWKALTDNDAGVPEIDLHLCPRCFLYSSCAEDLDSHKPNCRYAQTTPGQIVYNDGTLTIREFDGADTSTRLYLQCVALFGKCFLETKSICFALDGFIFYIVYENSSNLVAGFFSKEKRSWHNYNLACVVVLPPFQKRGIGRLLVGLSYYISRLGHTVGAPEQPLSEHGLKSYESYWRTEIARYLCLKPLKCVTIRSISDATGIDPCDIVSTLQTMGALSHNKNGDPALEFRIIYNFLKKTPLPPPFDESSVVSGWRPLSNVSD